MFLCRHFKTSDNCRNIAVRLYFSTKFFCHLTTHRFYTFINCDISKNIFMFINIIGHDMNIHSSQERTGDWLKRNVQHAVIAKRNN